MTIYTPERVRPLVISSSYISPLEETIWDCFKTDLGDYNYDSTDRITFVGLRVMLCKKRK